MRLSRGATFAVLCVFCAGLLGWYYARKAPKDSTSPSPPATSESQSPAASIPGVSLPQQAEPSQLEATAQQDTNGPRGAVRNSYGRIYFRWMHVDENYGRLTYVDHGKLDRPQFAEKLACEVVHYASGYGVCLKAERGFFTRYTAEVFGADHRVIHSIPLNGVPSRTRVSPDGRYAAATVFLTGHSYASVDFTTQTLLFDPAKGTALGDLEQFKITRDGKPFLREDFNFWGVSFAPDSSRFFCTLSSNRVHYLVEGDPASGTGRVLKEGVECPSVSPDGKLVAFKKRMPGPAVKWRIHVLELSTGLDTPLAETRSVDDQLEWLNESHVLYALPEKPDATTARMDVWTAPLWSKEPPRLFLPAAYSPAVVRKPVQ